VKAVNLIPVEERAGQPVGVGRSQGAAYAVLTLVCGLALLVYLYGSADHQIKSRHAQVASLDKQTQEVQQAAERLAPYTSFVAEREAREQAVETLIESRFDWAHVFHEFGRVLPAGVSVSSLTGTVGGTTTSGSAAASAPASGAAVASSTPPGTVPTFQLSGCATNQPTVALTLQRLHLIDGVSEVALSSSAGSGSASASSSSSSGAKCPAGGPTFNVTITFDPLPSAAAVASAVKTKTVADTTGASTATGGSGR
jgi:hypothetical protein